MKNDRYVSPVKLYDLVRPAQNIESIEPRHTDILALALEMRARIRQKHVETLIVEQLCERLNGYGRSGVTVLTNRDAAHVFSVVLDQECGEFVSVVCDDIHGLGVRLYLVEPTAVDAVIVGALFRFYRIDATENFLRRDDRTDHKTDGYDEYRRRDNYQRYHPTLHNTLPPNDVSQPLAARISVYIVSKRAPIVKPDNIHRYRAFT